MLFPSVITQFLKMKCEEEKWNFMLELFSWRHSMCWLDYAWNFLCRTIKNLMWLSKKKISREGFEFIYSIRMGILESYKCKFFVGINLKHTCGIPSRGRVRFSFDIFWEAFKEIFYDIEGQFSRKGSQMQRNLMT